MNRSELLPIEQIVLQSIDRLYEKPSPEFVIGVSGGVDSMVLLHIFKRLNIPASVVHINYQKRGEASDKDAQLVKQTAEAWGFSSKIITVDPQQAEGSNFQQWARKQRYRAYRREAENINAAGIALAHHKDDQIETILQKVFRGAGLQNWTAMEVWDGELFRPLLKVSRTDIEAYARHFDIPYRTDESNLKSEFARNFLRNEWLAQLKDFFPGWEQNILRISEQAHYYAQSIEWIATRVTDEQGIIRTEFDELDNGLQKAVVLQLIKKKLPGAEISRHSLERLKELPQMQPGKKIELSGGLHLVRDRNHYVIRQKEEELFSPVAIDRNEFKDKSLELSGVNLSLKPFEGLSELDQILYLDADKIAWPITLRLWRKGDTFQPLGMKGHQQVSDHLTNRKISPAHKREALVIESFEETICAVIFPPIKNITQPGTISEHVKCDDDTEKSLNIKYSNNIHVPL